MTAKSTSPLKPKTEVRIGKEIVTCAHCRGKGTTQHNCCQKKAGVQETFWTDPLARCCACGGAGKIRI